MIFFSSFNRNESSVKRPTSIDGLRPHLLEVPPNNHKRAHSEDSLNEIEEEDDDDETAKVVGLFSNQGFSTSLKSGN